MPSTNGARPVRDSLRAEFEFRMAQDAFSERRIEECLARFQRAEAFGYDPDACAACRWYCWMLLGRFEDAWQESDALVAGGKHDPHRFWDRKPFTGKRLMIRCLHGFGDAIQFLRYTPLIRREASRVIVQTHPQLVRLFRGIPSADEVTTWEGDAAEPEWDQQIEVMELAHVFRATLDNIPRETPYLWVDREYLTRSRQALGEKRHTRVGLLWQSGGWDLARDVPFAQLRPVLAASCVEFYSFQRGTGRRDLGTHPFAAGVRDISGDSPDVARFAADLMNMDLLITVDTMAAHLAGALGRPVWLLLPFAADWRWMLNRCDSPWYPTMRLFRQRRPNDWTEPVNEIARELAALAKLR